MDQTITTEQALKNIEVVIVQHFRGLREEHIVLEQSLIKIKNELKKLEPVGEKKQEEKIKN